MYFKSLTFFRSHAHHISFPKFDQKELFVVYYQNEKDHTYLELIYFINQFRYIINLKIYLLLHYLKF